MKRLRIISCTIIFFIFTAACGTGYKAKPLPFKDPAAYPNTREVAGALVAARAFVDPDEANEAFGFDIRGAGMLPVQVVFDNQGPHSLEINPEQTFLEDGEYNLWPILTRNIAYERATKYAKTKQIFREGAYHGFLGATAGALIGAAVGIVAGGDVGGSIGKGAVIGAAAGGTMGGIKGYSSDEARRAVIDDRRQKPLQTKSIAPGGLAHGFIFFPGEAQSAGQLRLQIVESDTGSTHTLLLDF